MDDHWNSTAPDLSREFTNAQSAEKTAIPKPEPPDIATKKELEELAKLLGKSAPGLQLTPPGANLVSALDQQRRARFKHVAQRLKNVDGKARDEFERTSE